MIHFFPSVFPLVKSNIILIYYYLLVSFKPVCPQILLLHSATQNIFDHCKICLFAKYSSTCFTASLSSTRPAALHSASPSIRSIHPTISCSLGSLVSLAFPKCFQGDKLAGTVLSARTWLLQTISCLLLQKPGLSDPRTPTPLLSSACLGTQPNSWRGRKKNPQPSASAKHSSSLFLSSTVQFSSLK